MFRKQGVVEQSLKPSTPAFALYIQDSTSPCCNSGSSDGTLYRAPERDIMMPVVLVAVLVTEYARRL
jgi:hypothetical protein